MENKKTHEELNTLVIISKDRERTNLLKKYEQKTIAYLVERIPEFISSDMLTGIGLFGNVIIFTAFVLAHFLQPYYLLIGVFGFMVSWFGDSLDGRIAYYRNKQRKWYGFALDLTTDWIGIVLVGIGFVIYAHNIWEFFGIGFVVLYGWEMLTTLLRYKITDQYSIDSGKLGPTEVRIVISLILILEVFVVGSIHYSAVLACIVLFISNIVDSIKLLKLANDRDRREKESAKNA
ncbi:MAG: CDP-alcohol phosphatidyltransferase family protein [Paludibacter sp.]|jgi:phosphatidylglycerophosphate synthase|nr:CDP-alcohol phosphatidyltransferase family protein [Paludibacter sp.]